MSGALGALLPESDVQRARGYGPGRKTEPAAMNWSTAFRVREFVRGSLWVLPLAGGLLGVVLGSGLIGADETLHLPTYWTYT